MYFQEQLELVSDLLLDRNYLWKAHFEKRFPPEFVFKQIYNENLPRGTFLIVKLRL